MDVGKGARWKWAEPVDILRYEHGFNEGNAAQYTWFVPHDLPGLLNCMAGKTSFQKS